MTETPQYPNTLTPGDIACQVGCRKCNTGLWKVFYDGGTEFTAQCEKCGHTINISPRSITNKADNQAIPLKFFT